MATIVKQTVEKEVIYFSDDDLARATAEVIDVCESVNDDWTDKETRLIIEVVGLILAVMERDATNLTEDK